MAFLFRILGICPYGCNNTFEDSWYMFSSKAVKVTRRNAAAACASAGANLADIKSAEEQNFIAAWLQDIDACDTWFDLYLNKTSNKIRWLSDGLPVVFTAWGTKEPTSELHPNAYHDDDVCVRFKRMSDYKWADERCSKLYNYICEREGNHDFISYTFGCRISPLFLKHCGIGHLKKLDCSLI